MEIAKYLLENYADTLKFRLTRFATVNVLLVTKGLVDEKIMKVDNLTMSSRVNRSALWKDGVAGVGQKVSLSTPAVPIMCCGNRLGMLTFGKLSSPAVEPNPSGRVIASSSCSLV